MTGERLKNLGIWIDLKEMDRYRLGKKGRYKIERKFGRPKRITD